MKLLKQSLFSSLFISIFFINACSDKTDVNVIRKVGIVLNGAQEVPAKPGSGNGTVDIEYNKDTRTLYYKVSWNSLTGNLAGFHIHGPAKRGFNASVIQNFVGFAAANQGTYSGNVFIDGVLFKETELLNGEYYINMHTATNPGGEIRGQLEFE
jgi:CHRD domain